MSALTIMTRKMTVDTSRMRNSCRIFSVSTSRRYPPIGRITKRIISGSSAATSNKVTLKATEKKDVAIEVEEAGYYELHITVESGEPAAGALIARVDSMTDVDGSGANFDLFYDLYDSVANGYWGVLNITDSDKVLHFQASSKYNDAGADVSFTS